MKNGIDTKLSSKDHIALTEEYGAHNYGPLPIVIAAGDGAWVWDVEGNKYLDLLSAYSALNFGHQNARILKAAEKQLHSLTLTSRAFYNDQFGLFCKELAEFSGYEMVLAMNSGAEAVESAIKVARRWGYERKNVEENKAEIICFADNFAGRTVTLVSFNTNEENFKGYGPFTPGFKVVPFGDHKAVEAAITKNTVAVLFEPIQGEAGIIIPPDGFLKEIRSICDRHNVLMIADEIQTGLGRTGAKFACDHEGVKPDVVLLGKSMGGGIVPISAMLSSKEVLGVLTPGSHGSTFGGNPLACAIAREVIKLITEEHPEERSRELGKRGLARLRGMKSPYIEEIRGRGLMIGIDINPKYGKAKDFCKKLKAHGVLCKDTRAQTIRLAPPLVISEQDLDWGLAQIEQVFSVPPGKSS